MKRHFRDIDPEMIPRGEYPPSHKEPSELTLKSPVKNTNINNNVDRWDMDRRIILLFVGCLVEDTIVPGKPMIVVPSHCTAHSGGEQVSSLRF